MAPRKLPKASEQATGTLDALAPAGAGVTRRLVFGQPTLFVNGNMFMGTFGGQIFVRLSEADRRRALSEPGMVMFQPMPGRPMTEYVVLSDGVLGDPRAARAWVRSSLEYARALPPKKAGPRKR
jgi:TfoX/Sxy family transcriptional regulator of competence genes